MFTIDEITKTLEITDLFKKTLLQGDKNKVSEVLDEPQLTEIWNKYFAGRVPKDVSKEYSNKNENWRDINEQILFYLVLLSQDRYNRIFWNILGRLYQQSGFSECDKYSYVCFLNQCQISNSKSDYKFLQNYCIDKGFWIEAHHAAYMAITRGKSTDNQVRGYAKFFCNNANKLVDPAITERFDKEKLISDIKTFFKTNINLLSHTEKYFTLGIFKEIEGDIPGAFEMHKKGYRSHRNPKILLKWAYYQSYLEEWEKFWEQETRDGIKDSEKYISLIYDLLIFAKDLGNIELEKQIAEFATSYPKPPSWRELNGFYSDIQRYNCPDSMLQVFELLYRLYPNDIAVCDVYAEALFALGRPETGIGIQEHILNHCKFSDEKYMDYCFKIILTCLIYKKRERIEQYAKKIDNVGRKLPRVRLANKLNLYKMRIRWLLSLYDKINETGEGEKEKARQAFINFCCAMNERGLYGVLVCLCNPENRTLLEFGETVEIVKSSQDFEVSKFLFSIFLESVTDRKELNEGVLRLSRKLNPVLYKCFTGDFSVGLLKMLEKRIMHDTVSATRQRCISLLESIDDEEKQKELLRFMLGVYDYRALVKGVMQSKFLDTERKAELRLEVYSLCLTAYEENSSFYFLCAEALMDLKRYKQAKEYYRYVAEYKNKIPKQDTSRIMMYICDIFIKAGIYEPMDLSSDRDLSYKVAALRRIITSKEYRDMADLIDSVHQRLNHPAAHIINSFKEKTAGNEIEALRHLENIKDNILLYESSVENLNYIIPMSGGDTMKPDRGAVHTNRRSEIPIANIVSDISRVSDNESLELINTFFTSSEKWHGIDDFSHLVPNLYHELTEFPDRGHENRESYFQSLKTSAKSMQKINEVQKLHDKAKLFLEAAKQAYLLNINVDFFLLFNEYVYTVIADFDYKKDYEGKLVFSYEFLVLLHGEIKAGLSVPDTYMDYALRNLFEAYISIDRPVDLFNRLKYLNSAIELFRISNYRYIPKISPVYVQVYDEIFDVIQQFIIKVKHYYESPEIAEKKVLLSHLSLNTADFSESISRKVSNPYKNLLHQFISSVDGLILKESRQLSKMPDIKPVILNIDRKLHESDALQFQIVNFGEAVAFDVSTDFRILKNENVVFSQEFFYETIRENEKIPVRIDHGLTEGGVYSVLVNVRTGDEEKQTVSLKETIEIIPDCSDDFSLIRDMFVLTPITDKKGFFGRKDILHTIENGLSDGIGNTTFIVYGLRRIGKSSLLYYIRNNFNDKFIPVYCDGEMYPANDTAELVYDMFVCEIVDGLSEQGIDIDLPSFEEFDRNPLIRLTRFFRAVERKLQDKKLLLLIDEFESIILSVQQGKYSQDLFKTIRSQMQHSEKIKIIIAGGGYLINMLVDEALSISDTSQPVEIGFHQRSEIYEMVQKPYEGILHYLPDTLERLFMLTNGHAYYVSILCKKVISILNKEKRYVVYPTDIEIAAKVALEVNQYGNYENMWESLSDVTEKIVLAAIAEELDYYNDYITMKKLYEKAEDIETRYGLNGLLYKTRVSSAVNNMLRINILAENPVSGGFRVSVELWRRWLKKAWSVQRVIEIYSKEIDAEMSRGEIAFE